METCETCRMLLSEALDLCVRARKLDAQIEHALAAGTDKPEWETRCATPALWVREQYDNDLKAWEERAIAYMSDGEHKERDDDANA